MRLRFFNILLAGTMFCLSSCEEGKKSSGGPIVLGDPSTIVTETDSTYLADMVMDMELKPVAQQPVQDTTAAPAQDTAQPAPQQVAAEQPKQPEEEKPVVKPQGKGLTVSFKELTVFIPDIAAKGSGTSYQLTSGSLNGKQLKIVQGDVQKVSQRYQTVVVAKNNLGTLVLDNLNTTTGWKPMNGGNSTYTISGLEASKLAAPKATPSTIRSAVSRAARKKRLSKSAEQKWQNSVKNARNANQKPLSVALRSVMWKLDGKDAKGKPFSKQIRIDIPL